MKQTDYWNSVAEEKNFTTDFQNDIFEKYVDKNAKILDFGCGYGRTLNELYQCGYKDLVGIDTSKNMIKRGKRSYPYLDFSVSEGNIPFDNGTFDAVILFGVFCSVVDAESQKSIINEIKRVLKPNGIIYVNDFLINNDFSYKSRYKKYVKEFGTYGIFKLADGGILRHHTEEYILNLLSDFKLIEYNKIKFKTTGGNTSNGFYYVGKLLE